MDIPRSIPILCSYYNLASLERFVCILVLVPSAFADKELILYL